MKKNIIIMVVTILLSSSALFGANNNRGSYQERIRKDANRGSMSGEDGSQINDKSGKSDDSYIDSVVYTDITERITLGRRKLILNSRGKKAIELGTPATEAAGEMAKLLSAEERARAERESSKREIPSYYTGGFCSVITPAEISKSSEFTTLECLLDFGGEMRRADVFAGLYPDHKREILIGVPIYITFESGNRASFDGIILRENKASMNLSDWTDSKRIRKLFAEGMLVANDIAYTYGSRFLNALEQSKVEQKTEYITTDDGNGSTRVVPVTSTNIEKPEIEDYIVAAGLEFLTSIFSIGGKSYLYDARPLFRMNAGKKVYIEGVVDFNKNRLGKKFGIIGKDERGTVEKNNQAEDALIMKKIQSYGVTRGGKIQLGEGR